MIMVDMECKLCSLGIMGVSTPQSLLNVVILQRKVFCIKRCKRAGRFEQLVQMKDPDSYTYYGYGSFRWSIRQKPVQNCNTTSAISHVWILDTYLTKIPPEIKSTDDFYLQPLLFVPTGNRPWFWPTPLEKN